MPPEAEVAPPVTVRRIQLRVRPAGTGRSVATPPPWLPQDTGMQLDGHADRGEDASETYGGAHTAGSQVEAPSHTPAEADIEAGSPVSTRHRRLMRSYTMRMGRQPSLLSQPMHARGSSDTTSMQTAGFASVNTLDALRGGYDGHEREAAGTEVGRADDDDDRMEID
ncbi:hypothetical protein F4825DRAFT_418328 [Nemania diffusa]|nr:hypothetical protein F4825DRAFT_418328 [Nemania diffusa]